MYSVEISYDKCYKALLELGQLYDPVILKLFLDKLCFFNMLNFLNTSDYENLTNKGFLEPKNLEEYNEFVEQIMSSIKTNIQEGIQKIEEIIKNSCEKLGVLKLQYDISPFNTNSFGEKYRFQINFLEGTFEIPPYRSIFSRRKKLFLINKVLKNTNFFGKYFREFNTLNDDLINGLEPLFIVIDFQKYKTYEPIFIKSLKLLNS